MEDDDFVSFYFYLEFFVLGSWFGTLCILPNSFEVLVLLVIVQFLVTNNLY